MIGSFGKLPYLNFVLLPLYIGIVYAIAYRYRDNHYKKNHPWRPYFIPALTAKIVGAVFIGLIYCYYYHGGDTFYYFYHAQVINSSFDESATKWVNLLFHTPKFNNGEYFAYISQMEWYGDPSSYTVASICAFINIFTFNNYLPTSVIFAGLSFTGVWALFRTFAGLYPNQTRPIAIAILFIPSVFIWGSGIFKDTVCLTGLGWLTYSSFRFLVQGDFSPKNIALCILSFVVIATTKLYIIMAFLPALIMWIFFNYSKKISNSSMRLFVKFLFIVVVIGGTMFFMQKLSSGLGKYSLENIAQTSLETRAWIGYVSDAEQGSGYDLGSFSPTIGGMLSKFPSAVNVTLFRPYPWEARKIIVFLSALEAILFFWLTLKTIFTVGLKKCWQTISRDPTIQVCLIFSVIFAFAVGISSYNFGTLSRYKIPCLPFYALAIILIYYKNIPAKKKLFKQLGI